MGWIFLGLDILCVQLFGVVLFYGARAQIQDHTCASAILLSYFEKAQSLGFSSRSTDQPRESKKWKRNICGEERLEISCYGDLRVRN